MDMVEISGKESGGGGGGVGRGVNLHGGVEAECCGGACGDSRLVHGRGRSSREKDGPGYGGGEAEEDEDEHVVGERTETVPSADSVVILGGGELGGSLSVAGISVRGPSGEHAIAVDVVHDDERWVSSSLRDGQTGGR
ncbi:hypothetical protein GUJ93_ZPchr0006g41063 [Zizania palustris]|uniref:Uncharacterized protein n=1 Tax=Zizania palustris TaxID=103762 RepID=A0A8J5VQB4_ZIZPA|nr:hypothetical protein GUJ93_ZPchr0006g41063 [Zizania palustris]